MPRTSVLCNLSAVKSSKVCFSYVCVNKKKTNFNFQQRFHILLVYE